MKKLGWIAGLSLGVLLSTPVLAQSAGTGTRTTQTQQKNVDVAEFDKQAAQIQENFKKMQEQMDKIRATKDPQENGIMEMLIISCNTLKNWVLPITTEVS